MMKRTLGLLATTAILLDAGFSHSASAQESAFSKDHWQFRLRAIDVVPDEDSWVNIGGDIDAKNDVVPEFDITYFFTDHIATELILATSKHELRHSAAGKLGDAWILPPTLTVQYHFDRSGKFSPYLGAGLNYSMFYGEDSAAGFSGLDVDGGLGYALQAGTDIWLDDHWGLNLDVKKVWLNVDATLNGGIRADVDLDPWIFGAGVSYRF